MVTSKKHKSRFKFKITARQLAGGFLAVVAGGLLLLAGYFLAGKYFTPPILAKILPADETLFYLELQTEAEDPAWQNLKDLFIEAQPTKLFDFDQFALPESAGLLDLVGDRAGLAFLGARYDPARWVLVLDIPDREQALAYFRMQTLAGEELATQNYHGSQLYFFPRSSALAFTFRGSDLLLAASLTDLQTVLADSLRVVDSVNFQTIQSTLSPKATGFVYFSPWAVQQFFTARLGGLSLALATPILDLFTAAGVSLAPDSTGLQIQTYFALQPENARENFFLRVPPYRSDLLALVGEEAVNFTATADIAGQLEQFISSGAALNSVFDALARGALDRLTRDYFGQSASFPKTLAPSLSHDFIAGRTESGGYFWLAAGGESDFAELLNQIETSTGTLAARRKGTILPDGTPGGVLAADAALVKTTELYRELPIQIFKFPSGTLYSAVFGERLIAATERETFDVLLNRVFDSTSGGFSQILTQFDSPADGYFYERLTPAVDSLFMPFRYLLAAPRADQAGYAVNFFLGR
jgi:hypothetical protein